MGAIVDTIMVTGLSLAVDDVVIRRPLVVILHSSVKSARVPGTVQSNFAAFENIIE